MYGRTEPLDGAELYAPCSVPGPSYRSIDTNAHAEEWYLALLATQQPEGWFEGWRVPAEKLGMSPQELERHALAVAEKWGLPAGAGSATVLSLSTPCSAAGAWPLNRDACDVCGF